MTIRRAGIILIFFSLSAIVGMVFNPLATAPATSHTYLNPKETIYTEFYLMGSGHVIRILVPDGFNGSFALVSESGEIEVKKNLNGPTIMPISIKKRGWYILALSNNSNETVDVTYEIAKTADLDWSAVLDMFFIACIGILLFLCGRVKHKGASS